MKRNQPITPLTDEQRALVADPRHIKLAERIATKFARRYPSLADEFESECYVALCGAARTFQDGRGVRFSTHATCRVRFAMSDVCRLWRFGGFPRNPDTPLTLSLDVVAETNSDGKRITFAELVPAGDGPVGWEAEYQDELEGMCLRLPANEATVVRLWFGHAEMETLRAVARHTGLSWSRVHQRKDIAIELLAERFGDHADVFMNGHAWGRPDGLVAPDWPALAAEIDAIKAAKKKAS